MRDVYGPALRRERKRRGWTIPDLAARVRALGAIDLGDRTKLSKVEARARGLTIEEWLILAAALEIPPAVLLSPYTVDFGDSERDPRPAPAIDIPPVVAGSSPHWVRSWIEGRSDVCIVRTEHDDLTYANWPVAAGRERWNAERWDNALTLVEDLERLNRRLALGDLADGVVSQLEADRASKLQQIRRLEAAMKADRILPFDLLYEEDAETADGLTSHADSERGRAATAARLNELAHQAIRDSMTALTEASGAHAAFKAAIRLLIDDGHEDEARSLIEFRRRVLTWEGQEP